MKKLSTLNSQLSTRKGFTLIELLIVIVIIGVLATILLANFIGVNQRARDSRRKSDLRQIQLALELYNSDQGIYPASLPGCLGSLTSGSTTYIKNISCDPLASATYYNNGNYYYTAPGGTSYTLCACLENANDSQGVTNGICSTEVSPTPTLTPIPTPIPSKTALPVGQGFYQTAWSSSPPLGPWKYPNIDDPIGSPDEDATTIQVVCTDVPDCIGLDAKDSWMFADPGIPVQATGINKVRVWIRARLGTGGSAGLRPFLRINNLDYELGVPILSLSYQWYSFEKTTNPNTGNPWQLSEVKTLEAGARSLGSPAVLYVTAVYIEIFYTVPSPSPTLIPSPGPGLSCNSGKFFFLQSQ